MAIQSPSYSPKDGDYTLQDQESISNSNSIIKEQEESISKIAQDQFGANNNSTESSLEKLKGKGKKKGYKSRAVEVMRQIKIDLNKKSFTNALPLANNIGKMLQEVEDVSDIQRDLIKLALAEAEKGGACANSLVINIKDFRINSDTAEGQEALVEIAQICVQNGVKISPYLSDIVFKEAKKNITVYWNLKDYGFEINTQEGQKKIIELAYFYVIDQPLGALSKSAMDSFPIKSEEKQKVWLEIVKSVVSHHTSIDVIGELHSYPIDWKSLEARLTLKEILVLAMMKGKADCEQIFKILQQLDNYVSSEHNNNLQNLNEYNFAEDLNEDNLMEQKREDSDLGSIQNQENYHPDIIEYVDGGQANNLEDQDEIVSLYSEDGLGDVKKDNLEDSNVYNESNKNSDMEDSNLINDKELKVDDSLNISEDIIYNIDNQLNINNNFNNIEDGGLTVANELNIENDDIKEEKKEDDLIPKSGFIGLYQENLALFNKLEEYATIKNQHEEMQELTFSQALPNFPFSKLLSLIDKEGLSLENKNQEQQKVLDEMIEIAQTYPHLPTTGLQKLIKESNPHLLKTNALWAASTTLCLSPIKSEDAQVVENIKDILENLINLRDLNLRYVFSDLLIKLQANQQLEQVIKTYQDIKKEVNFSSPLDTVNQAYTLLIFVLAIVGAQEEQDIKAFISIAKRLSQLKSNRTHALKNASKVKTLLRTLTIVSTNTRLFPEEKKQLLDKIIPLDTRDANLVSGMCSNVITLINLGKEEVVKELIHSNQFESDLDDAHKKSRFEVVPSNIHVSSNDLDCFLKTFRDSDLFLSYFYNLKKIVKEDLKGELIQQSINNFWVQILKNNYPKYRYEGSEHLKLIFEKRNDLKKKWTEELRVPLEKLQNNEEQIQLVKNQSLVEQSTDKKEKNQQAKDQSLIVVNTDNLDDLLVCGTEIQGSCLNIRGDSRNLKSLFNYIDDGKIRLIAVKEAAKDNNKDDGTIKGRALIRILWAKNRKSQKEEPILLLEKIYPTNASSKIKDGILEMAKATAKRLDIPLVAQQKGMNSKDDDKLNPISSDYLIYSLGTRGYPYEYIDSADGMCENKESMMDNSQLVEVK